MIPIRYFYRKTNPKFFSIEKVFNGVSHTIKKNYFDEFVVSRVDVKQYSKFKGIISNILFVKERAVKINHVTGDIHYTILGLPANSINILTIHDCVLLSQFSKKDPRYWMAYYLWFKLPVKKADFITVISEFTKNELLKLFPDAGQKVRVIDNFLDPVFEFTPGKFNDLLPVILFVGTTENKNFNNAVKAISGLNVHLRILGKLNSDQIQLLSDEKIQYSVVSGLDDKGVVQEYISSDLLLFPSIYEGFGLPILEAQAIGRPVITSNLAPMNYVSGGGACMVDPYNINSIRDGVTKIISNHQYRMEIIAKGQENILRFSLENISAQYVALYRELIATKMKTKMGSEQ